MHKRDKQTRECVLSGYSSLCVPHTVESPSKGHLNLGHLSLMSTVPAVPAT